MKYLLFSLLMGLATLQANAQVGETDWLQNQRPERYDEPTEAPLSQGQSGRRRIGSQQAAPLKASGVRHVPVVLVAFADKPFMTADSDEELRQYYDLFCNGTRDGRLYTGHGSHGSIRDYFVEQSDSAFLPEFTVIGPVTLDQGYAHYGANSGSAKDTNFALFRNEAIAKAMELQGNWSQFDNDDNGTIDMVFFLFAGLGESNGGDADCIWPKESTTSATINGVVFATSAATCECRPRSRDANGEITAVRTDGVGVFIHELSHALGLPDFYDTNYRGFGMDLWSVMDYGEYGNNGYNPGNYTAYERDFMGWRPVQELTEPCILTIPCFAEGGTGYKIVNEANPQEYYIIENRQAKGWDDRIGRIGHGLQVTHVDFDQAAWNGNRVNTVVNHQRMTIIAANNNYTGTNNAPGATDQEKMQHWQEALMGHLYPGDTYNYELTDESVPAAEVFTGVLMHKPLRNITENADGTVTVCYRTNGRLATPELREAANVVVDGFDAEWDEVEHATAYALEVRSAGEGLLLADTVSDTHCHLTGLPQGATVSLRVQAMADSPEDYLSSAWSEVTYVDLPPDVISDVPDSEKRVEVYALNGACIDRCYANQLHRLRRGCYVLRYANGAARKVFIR